MDGSAMWDSHRAPLACVCQNNEVATLRLPHAVAPPRTLPTHLLFFSFLCFFFLSLRSSSPLDSAAPPPGSPLSPRLRLRSARSASLACTQEAAAGQQHG